MSKTELRTRRLIGTPASPSDFADIRRLHSDSRVMATLSADGNTFSEEQSRAFLERAADHWKSHGFGLWIFREDSGGDFVGYGGIQHADGRRPRRRSNSPTRSAPTTGAKDSRPKSQSPH